MSAAYLDAKVHLDPGGRVHAEFALRNDSRQAWRAADDFAVGYHVFDAETGTLLLDGPRRHPAGEIRTRRDGARQPGFPGAAGERPVSGDCFSHARERLLVLCRRLAVPAGGNRRARWRRPARARPRGYLRPAAPRAPAARLRPRFHLSAAHHLAQPRPDPRDDAARRPGPLPRLLLRLALDHPQPAAPHADVLLRFRGGAARPVPRRPQPVGLRPVLPGRHAPLAGFQRGRRPRPHRHAGAPQFRPQAGVRGGNPACESGGRRPGHRIFRRDSVLRHSAGRAPRRARRRAVAAGAPRSRKSSSPSG